MIGTKRNNPEEQFIDDEEPDKDDFKSDLAYLVFLVILISVNGSVLLYLSRTDSGLGQNEIIGFSLLIGLSLTVASLAAPLWKYYQPFPGRKKASDDELETLVTENPVYNNEV